MAYIVKGNFSASLSLYIVEAISSARIRIYRIDEESAIGLKKGDTKKEVQILSKKEISDKESCLIGKAKTDLEGNYEMELSGKYKEEPIAIDLVLSHLPGQKKPRKDKVQITIRKLKPIWRNENDGLQYIWNYCLPFEFWCQMRTMFDAWTICGYVKPAKNSQDAIPGLKVSALDADWVKDDMLGSCITNGKGYFRIDFNSSDFKRTFLSPIINVETPISPISGPGVYFKATAEDGSVIYEEDKTEARTAERKHIPRCYCLDLYLTDSKNKRIS